MERLVCMDVASYTHHCKISEFYCLLQVLGKYSDVRNARVRRNTVIYIDKIVM